MMSLSRDKVRGSPAARETHPCVLTGADGEALVLGVRRQAGLPFVGGRAHVTLVRHGLAGGLGPVLDRLVHERRPLPADIDRLADLGEGLVDLLVAEER